MNVLRPWHWRSLPLNGKSGTEVFAALFQHQPIAVLLESPSNSAAAVALLPHSRFSICAGSPRQQDGGDRLWTPDLGQIFDCLTARLQEGESLSPDEASPSHLPFTGGWLGWLGYDVAWEIETLPWLRSDTLPFPVAFWYEPETFAVLDHQQQQLWLAASDPQDLDHLETQLHQPIVLPIEPPYGNEATQQYRNLSIDLSQATFEEMVKTAKQHIQAGDVFQTNLSLRYRAEAYLHPWRLYKVLQQINPSPFASYWQTPWGCVVSGSPERLVEHHHGQAQTRPIAGTRPRGDTAAAEQDYIQALLNSPKERAEHIMLVDLERNDLGRVCEWGSVEVDELLSVEFYSHVMHLVSNVKGKLHPKATPIDLIQAVFPGGTITGCPKVRCMELIETLEPVRRSLFYGSCGYLDVRGHLDLNILIRTLLITAADLKPAPWHQTTLQHTHLWGQVGAGIVADSDPTQEWLESLQKAKAQWKALNNIAKNIAENSW